VATKTPTAIVSACLYHLVGGMVQHKDNMELQQQCDSNAAGLTMYKRRTQRLQKCLAKSNTPKQPQITQTLAVNIQLSDQPSPILIITMCRLINKYAACGCFHELAKVSPCRSSKSSPDIDCGEKKVIDGTLVVAARCNKHPHATWAVGTYITKARRRPRLHPRVLSCIPM